MLLELLSDFQISIPELGVVRALPSARAADLEQHPRADRGAQAPVPLPVAGLPGARARARDRPPARPELSGTVARRLVEVVHAIRELDVKKPLHRRVDRLGAGAVPAGSRGDRPRDPARHAERDRQAPHRPRRGGGAARPRRRARGARAAVTAELRRGGFAGRLLVLCDELRARASPSARPRSSTPSTPLRPSRGRARSTSARRWPPRWRSRRRTAASSTRPGMYSAPSRRRPSSTPRARRSRAAGWGGRHRAAGARDGGAGGGRRRAARPRAPGHRGARRAGEPGGAAAVDMQRIRRALDLPRRRPGDPPRDSPHGRPPRADRALRAPPPARARARPGRPHRGPAARPAAARAGPRAAHRPGGRPRRGTGGPAQAPPRDPGAGSAATGARAPWTCAARSAPRSRRAGCRCAYATARAGPGGRSSTCCAMSPRA